MLIGGFQRQSLIDYPGKICSIVFTVGCNFRCPFCHNPELVLQEKNGIATVDEEKIFFYLDKKRKLIDAVEITGGEPTLQKDLIGFIKKLKARDFQVKLDTNGTNPEMIKQLIGDGMVDYIAMDIKAPPNFESYNRAVGGILTEDMFANVKESVELIKRSSIKYEFRTTVVKELLSPKDILDVGLMIKGAKTYVLQKFVPSKTLNPEFLDKTTYSPSEFEDIMKVLENYVDKCFVR
ncbi:MAG: anaerobic ribonucleoside-triphosphate reductase activating protein [Nitrospiraceae bacterium]|nr:anaerobic ribonucleoside-triphosphate reductase activating protein [Nitrospiraceae bacterium]